METARQHGVVSREQLLVAGFTPRVIDRSVEAGRLHVVHPGVYAVGYVSGSPLQRAMAAVLACDAVLSHRSAAALWGFGPDWHGDVEVTTANQHRLRTISAHRSRLAAGEVARRRGIPVTTVPRTLLDLAAVLDERALARAVNEARVLRLLRPGLVLPQRPGRRGVARVRRLIELAETPTRSVLEDAFLAIVDRSGLPRPEVNRRVAGYEVDMLWRQQRLVVELDGRRFHNHPDAFERDRRKDAQLLVAGYRVVRVTWRRLVDDPAGEAARLRALL
jgi:hypothetical protein